MRQLASALLAMSSSAVNPTCKTPATKLLLTGDVMIGRGVDQILTFPSNPVIYEGYMKSALGYIEIAERISGVIPRSVPADCARTAQQPTTGLLVPSCLHRVFIASHPSALSHLDPLHDCRHLGRRAADDARLEARHRCCHHKPGDQRHDQRGLLARQKHQL